MKGATLNLDGRKLASLALIPLFLILIGVLAGLNIPGSLEYPFALALLNTFFLGIIPIVIAYLTFRVVSRSGSASVFLLGSGVLVFGLGSIVAGWVNPLPGGPNMTVTIHNTCAFIGSILIFAGAVIRRPGSKTGAGNVRAGMVAVAYAGIFIFVAALSFAALQGLTPPFFVPGSGPIMLRQVILENAVLLFAISSGLFMAVLCRERSDFFFWYSGGLALIAIGLLAVFVQPSVGSLIGWVGRFAQYFGFVYALNAILIARKTAEEKGLPLEEVIAGFFTDAEQSYTTLVETATDAIVVFDSDDRVIVWNQAAEKVFGYRKEEAMGSSFMDLAIPEESAGIIKNNFRSHGIPGAGSAVQKPVEITVRRKDGSTVPAELTLSRQMIGGMEVSTCIIRDLTDRKRAAEVLQKSEYSLAEGQRMANIGSWEWDLESGTFTWSRHLYDIFGENPESFTLNFDSFMALVHPDDRQYIGEVTQRVVENGEPDVVFEYRIRARDGSERTILSRAEVVSWKNSHPLLLIGTAMDITERKKTEEALRESESILQSFFNVQGAMRGIVEVIADDDVRHLMDNVITAGFIGRTPEKLKNMLGTEIGESKDILRIWVSHYRESQRSGSPVSFEYMDKRGDHEVWLQATVSYLGMPPGGCPRFAYVVTDITAHKMAEEKLRYHASLIETISDAVISTDTGLTILSWNKAAEMVYGWRPDEVLGKKGSEILMTEFPEGTDRETITRYLFEKGIWHGELIQRTKAGDVITVEATSMRLKDETGRTIGAVSVSRNITERKRAEEALAFQARLLSDVHDAVFSSDSSYSITYWNQAAEKMFGWTKEEVLGKNSGELLKPKVASSSPDQERSKLRSAGHWEGEVQYIRKDGTFLLVEVNSTVLNDPQGKDIGNVVVARDITDRKQAGEALHESEARFRSVLDNSRDFMYRTNLKTGHYEYVSPSVKEVLGYTPDEFASLDSQTSMAMVHPDDLSAVMKAMERLEETSTGEMEYRLRNKQGEYRWVSNYLSVIKDSSGRPLYRGGNVRDITRRKTAEEKLANLAAIVEYSDDAIIGKTLDGIITSWNTSAGKIYGYSAVEAIGRSISILVPPDKTDDIEYVLGKIKRGESFVHYETQRIRKDGKTINVFLTLSPIRDSTGQLIGASTIARDITERKQAEEELKQKHEDLSAAYEEIASTQEELRQNIEELSAREEDLSKALAEKEVLLSEIHHRVKNNLAAFISLLGLEGSYEESPAGKSLKKDLQNRARSMALIHETLYKTHRYSDVDMEVYLSTLISQVVDSYRSAQSVRIVIEAKGVTLDLARATPTGLIVNELITNSLKYAFPPGFDCMAIRGEPCTIRVFLVREDGTHLLTVSDNGRGLPAEIDPRATKSLGLKLVNFLARHQLRAKIEIRTDKGTEFIFRLNKREDYA